MERKGVSSSFSRLSGILAKSVKALVVNNGADLYILPVFTGREHGWCGQAFEHGPC